jgi:putative spermidine/putrescine transport system permease protein
MAASGLDVRTLKRQLARAERRAKARAFLLVAPLLLFVALSFLSPIFTLVRGAVYNDLVAANLPETTRLLKHWRIDEPPSEPLCAAFVTEMQAAKGKDLALPSRIATFVNRERAGSLSRIKQAANATLKPPYCAALADLNADWASPEIWRALKVVAPALTPRFLLQALDLRLQADGGVRAAGDDEAIHLMLFKRTLAVAAAVTLACAALGYPVAYLLAQVSTRVANLLLIVVLLPFWTSLLVRTTAWIALLQQNGVVNDTLVALHILDDGHRLEMMYNMFATLIVMTHVLLPFMILPLYSVMKGVSPTFVRAALSLGASPWTAFLKVYVPQTIPGLGAGSLLVFILAIGYYITPALVGGQSGQLISNIIAFHMQKTLNWPLASAIGALLLVGVLLLFWLYNRLVGADKMKLA